MQIPLFPLLFHAALQTSCASMIKATQFINLTAAYGAGIYISDSSCSISVVKCFFYNDYATTSGGSMYVYANCFNCSNCCIEQCQSAYFGSSLYSDGGTCSLIRVSSFGCKYYSSSTNNARTVFINNSVERFTNLNLSFNTAYLYASIMWTSGSTSCIGNLSTFFNNTDVAYGASVDIQSTPSPYTFGMNNYIQNRPKSIDGFIWRDGGNTQVIFDQCLFVDNGNYSYIVLGSASTTYPTFTSCVFDIAASRLSSATTQSCSFLAGTQTLIYANVIQIASCNNIGASDEFTSVAKVDPLSLLETNFLLIIDSFQAF